MLSAAGVHAEPAPAGVEFAGAPGCPPVEVFAQQVAARTPVFREHAAEYSVRIELVDEPGGVLGRVSLLLSGHAAERELRAARCEEVVEALALVVAILIDPNADTRPLTAVAAPPPRTEPAPPPPSALPPPPTRAPASRPRVAPRRPSAPSRPKGPDYRFIAGAHAAAEGAVTPELTLGPRAFLGVELRKGLPWPTAFRLSGARLFSRRLRDDAGSVALKLDVVRADGCFVRLEQGRLALEPCVGFDAGALRADSAHLSGDRDPTLLWAAVGGMVRSSVAITGRFVGEAEIGADVPLVQYRFSFQGGSTLFQTARVGMHLGLGLGVRFP